MNVLSLFNGAGMAKVAFDRAGINVKRFYSSEIDKYAIKINQKNHPDSIELGDICDWREWDIDFSEIDLIIGGSPCQGFSFAGHQLAFDDPRSALFFKYVEILNHVKALNPDVKFLLENVKMAEEHISVISHYLEVEPTLINSALVSAQNRERLYWSNWEITQPQDKGILLRDIVEDLSIPKNIAQSGIEKITNINPSGRGMNGEVIGVNGKCSTLTTNKGEGLKIGFVGGAIRGRYVNGGVFQQIEKRSDSKTNTLTTVSKDCLLVIEGTADLKGNDQIKRIYNVNGKCPTLTTMQGGHQEPKIKTSKELAYSTGKDKAGNLIYWRKLTPIECEYLQTLPKNYTKGVSNSQRYKILGNGFTVDVIAHILSTMHIEKREQLSLAI